MPPLNEHNLIRDMVRYNIPQDQWEAMTPLARVVLLNHLVRSARESRTRYFLQKKLAIDGHSVALSAFRKLKTGPKPKAQRIAA